MSFDYFADQYQHFDAVQARLPEEGMRRGDRERVIRALPRFLEEQLGPGTDWYAGIEAMALWVATFEALQDGDSRQAVRNAYLARLGAFGQGQNEFALMEAHRRLTDAGLDLRPTAKDVAKLPEGSFLLDLQFTLARPYLSKDDEPLYPYDAPVVKDPAFKVPLVRPSSWKGALRNSAARMVPGMAEFLAALRTPPDPPERVLQRLFGHEKGTEQKAREQGHEPGDLFCRGRLVFFPTFFDRLTVEFINPHDRATKAGTNPIPLEAVPAGAKGRFTLLYTPFGGYPRADLERGLVPDPVAEMRVDLAVTVQSVARLLLRDGFGAKTGDDYGCARPNVQASLAVNPAWPALAVSEKSVNLRQFSGGVVNACLAWAREDN